MNDVVEYVEEEMSLQKEERLSRRKREKIESYPVGKRAKWKIFVKHSLEDLVNGE